MRQEESKEYRAGFCRSVGLIYAFTPFLAHKRPWNEESVLLSLSYSSVSTKLGKSAQQQNLQPAVGPGRRWFSGQELNRVGYACSLPACRRAVEEAAAAKRAVCSALSSGSCSNPWSAEQNRLWSLKNTVVSPVSPPIHSPSRALKNPPFLYVEIKCRWKNIASARGNSSSQVIASLRWSDAFGQHGTCPTPHRCHFHRGLGVLGAIL